jgi:hypothetical protein
MHTVSYTNTKGKTQKIKRTPFANTKHYHYPDTMAKRKQANKNATASSKSPRRTSGSGSDGGAALPPAEPYNWMKPGAPLKFNNVVHKLISLPTLDSTTGIWSVTLLHPVELKSIHAECSECSLSTKSLGSTVDLIVKVPNTCSVGDELHFQLPSTTEDQCESITIRVPERPKATRGTTDGDDSTFVVVRVSGEVIHLSTAAKQIAAKNKAPVSNSKKSQQDTIAVGKEKARKEVEKLPPGALKTVLLDPGQPLGLTMFNPGDPKPETSTPFLYMVSEVKEGSQCQIKGVNENDCIYTIDGSVALAANDLFDSYRAAKAKAIEEDRLLKVTFVEYQNGKK